MTDTASQLCLESMPGEVQAEIFKFVGNDALFKICLLSLSLVKEAQRTLFRRDLEPGRHKYKALWWAINTTSRDDVGVRIVDLTFSHGADINYLYRTSMAMKTAIHIAAECGKNLVILALLKHGASLSAPSLTLVRPQMYMRNELFAALGTDTDYRACRLWLPLSGAIMRNKKDTARMLIEHGAPAQLTMQSETDWTSESVTSPQEARTIFHYAIYMGDVKFLKEIAAAFPNDMDYRCPQDHRTALHCAARHGKLSMVAILVELGCMVECRDISGNTPLIKAVELAVSSEDPAARKRGYDIASYLMGKGADVNVQSHDLYGHTPLVKAISALQYDMSSNHYRIKSLMRLLYKHGANPELPERRGASPMSYLCRIAAGSSSTPSMKGYITLFVKEFGVKPNCTVMANANTWPVSLMCFVIENRKLRSLCTTLAECGARITEEEFLRVFESWLLEAP